jgi:hypothetical protein
MPFASSTRVARLAGLALIAVLSGCAEYLNPGAAALISREQANSLGAAANIRAADDLELNLTAAGLCAAKYGAVTRASVSVAQAVRDACGSPAGMMLISTQSAATATTTIPATVVVQPLSAAPPK